MSSDIPRRLTREWSPIPSHPCRRPLAFSRCLSVSVFPRTDAGTHRVTRTSRRTTSESLQRASGAVLRTARRAERVACPGRSPHPVGSSDCDPSLTGQFIRSWWAEESCRSPGPIPVSGVRVVSAHGRRGGGMYGEAAERVYSEYRRNAPANVIAFPLHQEGPEAA